VGMLNLVRLVAGGNIFYKGQRVAQR